MSGSFKEGIDNVAQCRLPDRVSGNDGGIDVAQSDLHVLHVSFVFEHTQLRAHGRVGHRPGKVLENLALGTGAIIAGLSERFAPGNDAAKLACDLFRANAEQLTAALHRTRAAEQLRGLGLEGDVADTAFLDRFDLVPEFDSASSRIVSADFEIGREEGGWHGLTPSGG